ncbi:UNVERIFIED_CONTAM: hypothetical protein K2H54_074629 [Gekko kuhli]
MGWLWAVFPLSLHLHGMSGSFLVQATIFRWSADLPPLKFFGQEYLAKKMCLVAYIQKLSVNKLIHLVSACDSMEEANSLTRKTCFCSQIYQPYTRSLLSDSQTPLTLHSYLSCLKDHLFPCIF